MKINTLLNVYHADNDYIEKINKNRNKLKSKIIFPFIHKNDPTRTFSINHYDLLNSIYSLVLDNVFLFENKIEEFWTIDSFSSEKPLVFTKNGEVLKIEINFSNQSNSIVEFVSSNPQRLMPMSHQHTFLASLLNTETSVSGSISLSFDNDNDIYQVDNIDITEVSINKLLRYVSNRVFLMQNPIDSLDSIKSSLDDENQKLFDQFLISKNITFLQKIINIRRSRK